jgi:hypothetical protein
MTEPNAQHDQIAYLRKVAGIRQGVINKLEKRIKRLEDENLRLRGIDA